jgi:hypothetical protein
MIAGQKPDDLASLAEGDAEAMEKGPSEEQLIEYAGYLNSRNHIIAALAALLALSVITNLVFLTTRG